MRNFLRSNRGSAAFATVIALVPLIGVVALGGEAGSWYVTRQHAQDAADAAAYSGALRLACTVAADGTCDAQSVAYRGKEFAAQNAFCNAGDITSYPGSNCASSLPTGVSQAVTINTLTTWNGNSGNFVQAIVSQTQPAYLAAILGLTTITIPAQAVAQVKQTTPPCVLALTDPVNFGGSTTVTSTNCGVQSNNTSAGSVTVTGSGNTVSVKSLSAAGGCSQNGSNNTCASVNTFDLPAVDPLSGLNSVMQSLTTGSFPDGKCKTQPTAYNSSVKGDACYNTSLGSAPLNGVYFFSGSVTINGSATITGTATLMLLAGSSLTINGNPTIQISAPSSVSSTQVPSALSSVTSLMSSLLIYDPEGASWSSAGCKNKGVSLSGSSTTYFSGITYVPYCDVTFTGNNTSSTPGSTCTELIAKGVTFTGSSYFDESGCPPSVKIKSQVVALVQ